MRSEPRVRWPLASRRCCCHAMRWSYADDVDFQHALDEVRVPLSAVTPSGCTPT